MSSSLSSSDDLQDHIILNTITPATATTAIVDAPNAADTPVSTPQFRYNTLPYQFHQFFYDQTPESLGIQLEDLELPTMEGRLQVHAVMNMINFIGDIKLNLLECMGMIKSILDCKTEAQMFDIRLQLSEAVVRKEVYAEVIGLFDYIVCTNFDEEDMSNLWYCNEFDDVEECERNQLQDIKVLVSNDLLTLKSLAHDLVMVVRRADTSVGVSENAAEAMSVAPVMVDDIESGGRAKLENEPMNQVCRKIVELDSNQDDKAYPVKQNDDTEDAKTGIEVFEAFIENYFRETGHENDGATEIVGELVGKLENAVDNDLGRFVENVADSTVIEADDKVNVAAKEDGDVGCFAEVIAQEIMDEIVEQVVNKIEEGPIEKIARDTVEQKIDMVVLVENNEKSGITDQSKINDVEQIKEIIKNVSDETVAKVVEGAAKNLAVAIVEGVVDKLAKDVDEGADYPIPDTLGENGKQVEVMAEKATHKEHKSFSGVTD